MSNYYFCNEESGKSNSMKRCKNNSEKCDVESILRNHVTDRGIRKVIVGVSGGADSMALLHGLRKIGSDVIAVHCNFHLRGSESERDMEHVLNYCKNSGIHCEVLHIDVDSYRIEFGGSVEMACRKLRYEEFQKILMSKNADRIAVAHNANDQAETVLLNLMRGAGVAGMRGMISDNGVILRPFLGISRSEIESYLLSEGIKYVTDSTNLSSDYRRNFLRNEVIPLLETRWPNAGESICRTSRNMASDEKILEYVERSILSPDDDSLPYESIGDSPDIAWIIRRYAKRYDASDRQIEEMVTGFNRGAIQSGKFWLVRDGKIVMERDRLQYIQNKIHQKISIKAEYFAAKDLKMDEILKGGLNELWATLPPEEIEFRSPRTGDRINPLGMSGSSPVSKIMKDNKMSQSEKESVIVAVERQDGEIIWIRGLKRSRHYLIKPGIKGAYRYRAEWDKSNNFRNK